MEKTISDLVPSGITGVVVMIIYFAYKLIKTSSCRSYCCGFASTFEIDLERGLQP